VKEDGDQSENGVSFYLNTVTGNVSNVQGTVDDSALNAGRMERNAFLPLSERFRAWPRSARLSHAYKRADVASYGLGV
jgi:hypothetical protein